MDKSIATLVVSQTTPTLPLLRLPQSFEKISDFTCWIDNDRRILGFLNGKSIPMRVSQCLLLIEDYDGNLDIMGDVYIRMGGSRHHCFCVGFITCKERMATGTGIFVTKNHDYYLVTPARSLCAPWNGMEGHPGAVVLFDEERNMTLQLENHVQLEIPGIPERPVNRNWDYTSAAAH